MNTGYWVFYGSTKFEVNMANRVQTLDEAVYISYSANTLGKSMNPAILPPALDK